MRRGKVHRQLFRLIPLLVIREGKVSYQANCRPHLFLSGICSPNATTSARRRRWGWSADQSRSVKSFALNRTRVEKKVRQGRA